jgi:hypothetical protein
MGEHTGLADCGLDFDACRLLSPGGPTRHHGLWGRLLGSTRPVRSRLTRGQSAGPPPGTRPGRGGAASKAVSGPAPLAPAGSVLGNRRGPSSAWPRPRFSPAFPGPAHDEGSGCSGGSLSCRPGLAPRASCGATFGGRQSETWLGGFAQASQSRGPGTDRPGSSALALPPRPRVTPGGDTFAARPLVPKRPL